MAYDFVVAPFADPTRIRVGTQGADGIRVDGDGTLRVLFGAEEIVHSRPQIFQEGPQGRVRVAGGF